MNETSPPERVRVTSPPSRGVRARRVATTTEIDTRSALGQIYIATLMRVQFRLALRVLALLAVLVGGLPWLFATHPGINDVRVWGMPLPWVVLAFGIYPLLVILALGYVRRADRHEQVFTTLVSPERSDPS